MIDGAVAGLPADDPAVLRVLVAIHGDETWGGDEPGRGAERDVPVPRRGGSAQDRGVPVDSAAGPAATLP